MKMHRLCDMHPNAATVVVARLSTQRTVAGVTFTGFDSVTHGSQYGTDLLASIHELQHNRSYYVRSDAWKSAIHHNRDRIQFGTVDFVIDEDLQSGLSGQIGSSYENETMYVKPSDRYTDLVGKSSGVDFGVVGLEVRRVEGITVSDRNTSGGDGDRKSVV